jgi:hypothetical protein
MLGGQFIFGDVMHVQLTNFSGVPIRTDLFANIQTNTLNQEQQAFTNQTQPWISQIQNPATYLGSAAIIAWDLILLISGFYIFGIMNDMQVPLIFIMGFMALYTFFLGRSIMGFVRGI